MWCRGLDLLPRGAGMRNRVVSGQLRRLALLGVWARVWVRNRRWGFVMWKARVRFRITECGFCLFLLCRVRIGDGGGGYLRAVVEISVYNLELARDMDSYNLRRLLRLRFRLRLHAFIIHPNGEALWRGIGLLGQLLLNWLRGIGLGRHELLFVSENHHWSRLWVISKCGGMTRPSIAAGIYRVLIQT